MLGRQFKIATSQGPQTTPVSIATRTRANGSQCRCRAERKAGGHHGYPETLPMRHGGRPPPVYFPITNSRILDLVLIRAKELVFFCFWEELHNVKHRIV